jgi:YVTN family beta-propeller protein
LSTNGVSNDVSVIDVAGLKVVKSIPVGSFPWGVAVSPQ